MKKIFLISTLMLFSFSLVFSAEKGSIKIRKGEKNPRLYEPETTIMNDGVSSSKPVIHNNRNGSIITLVD